MDNLFNNFYRGKTVLITGHTGFKGTWLSLWLTEMGAHVVGYSLVAIEGGIFTKLNMNEKLTHIIGDIRDKKRLEEVLQKHRPEIVFHLAAQALVRYSYDEPIETYEVNVLGTMNLLNSCRACSSVKTIINVTSDKCYQNRETLHPYKESDPMGGYDPYSSSKACSEILTASFRQSFFSNADYGIKHNIVLASARAGNVIGGGDCCQDRLIPDCAQAIACDEVITLRNPNALRPWQHVLEPLSGYLLLGAKANESPQKYASAWNFGPHSESHQSVLDIVEKFIKVWGRGTVRVVEDATKHEANLLQLNIEKVQKELGWCPNYTIEMCLEQTASWYKFAHEKEPSADILYDFTLKQIHYYIDQAQKNNCPWSL